VLVTHERDIARYTRRIVELRDGHVMRDVAVAERANAAEDLRLLRLDGEEAS